MVKRPQIDKKTLNNLYSQQKLSTYKIAEIYKCFPAQIRVLLKKCGVKIRSKQQAMFIDRGVNITQVELCKLYIKQDLSTHEISKRYNCYASTISDYLRRYKIPIKPPRKKFIASKCELKQLYIGKKMSIRDVARKLKTSEITVTKRMKDYGITPRPLKRVFVAKKTFLDLYKKGYSLKKIGLFYDINPSALLKKAQAYGIVLRKSWETNTKYKKKEFSGSSTEKAYLIGFRLGDLGVRKSSERTNNIIVGCNSTKTEQIELINKLFSRYSHMWIGKKRRDNAISISTLLHPSFSFLLPKQDSIEPWILKNHVCTSAFIAGYTDAEGNFGVYNGRAKFRVGSCDIGILNQIDAYFRENGIKSHLRLDRKMQKNPKYKILNKDFWRITVNEMKSLLHLVSLLKPHLRHKKRKGDMRRVERNILSRMKQKWYNPHMNKVFITCAIPYVNASPHVGHALEYVVADTIHRYHELTGKDVFIASGADENALKNVQAAEKAGLPIQKFLDKNSKVFQEFYKLLEVDLDVFRRASDQKLHWPGVAELWKLVEKSGDLYQKKYKGLYCVGCESFKTEKELVAGKCPEHDKEPVVVEEENYFFRLTKYQNRLIKLIETDEYRITPEKRKNEALAFLAGGLEDFSVSRSNERAKGVGVPVPGDPTQKIYVWFDALTIYMTATGYGYDRVLWKKWWPADLHIIGKDIFRFHAIYWPAMLLSARLPLPKQLLVHGFVTSGGRKMSKSIGNVVDPYKIIEKYGVEPLRYYLLSQIPTLDDGDFTEERFREVYNADLANGLGNLVARVAGLGQVTKLPSNQATEPEFSKEVVDAFEGYRLNEALGAIWERIKKADVLINERQVWNLKGEEKKEVLNKLIAEVGQITYDLKPFLPETAEKIEKQFAGPVIKSRSPLFPRL